MFVIFSRPTMSDSASDTQFIPTGTAAAVHTLFKNAPDIQHANQPADACDYHEGEGERDTRRPTWWGPQEDRAPELSLRNSLSIAGRAHCSRTGPPHRSAGFT